mmetsp:Transcript_55845/g.130685  ORF Transcript_55845/g.130685 Transcript_55845/m.130685 type:complete len:222 (-) Transcript_55845:424-1089(-)
MNALDGLWSYPTLNHKLQLAALKIHQGRKLSTSGNVRGAVDAAPYPLPSALILKVLVCLPFASLQAGCEDPWHETNLCSVVGHSPLARGAVQSQPCVATLVLSHHSHSKLLPTNRLSVVDPTSNLRRHNRFATKVLVPSEVKDLMSERFDDMTRIAHHMNEGTEEEVIVEPIRGGVTRCRLFHVMGVRLPSFGMSLHTSLQPHQWQHIGFAIHALDVARHS